MRRFVAGAMVAGTIVAFATQAQAAGSSVGPISFEAPTYHLGDINGQDGWSKTGPYDVAVADVSTFANAAGFGFGGQALRLSNSVASGSFSDQTFSPGLSAPAGELTGQNHFDASFSIGSTQASVQPGLITSVSPDPGDGSRVSYLRFEDQDNGIHVFFIDVHQAGPCSPAGCANFVEKDIATLSRTQAHTIRFSIDFVPGPGNDVVKVFIDGSAKVTGTTWEDYYRYDPEQDGNGHVVPNVSKLLFREGGSSVPGNAGNGFLVDGVSLGSSNVGTTSFCGSVFAGGTYTNVTVPSGATCTLGPNTTVTNDVNVQKGGTLLMVQSSIGHNLKADHPQGIGIYLDSSIGNDANIDGTTGGSGDGFNYICKTSIGHDLNVVNSAATASPWSIGGSDCGVGNTVGHDLNVNKNKNSVDVSRNVVANNMSVSGNTGGGSVTDNTVTHDANCGGNNPPLTESGNTAPHKNTC